MSNAADIAKMQVATKLIRSVRGTIQLMGILPSVWALALIEELAFIVITQPKSGITIGENLGVTIKTLRETVRDLQANPREVPSTSVLLRVLEGREPLDETDALLMRTIGNTER